LLVDQPSVLVAAGQTEDKPLTTVMSHHYSEVTSLLETVRTVTSLHETVRTVT